MDGLVTDEPDVVLVTYYADCVPLYFLDPEKRVIGLAHGGWRGTAGRIGRKMVDKMKAEYGCRPERIIGAVSYTHLQELKDLHIERLNQGKGSVVAGTVFMDMLTNL